MNQGIEFNGRGTWKRSCQGRDYKDIVYCGGVRKARKTGSHKVEDQARWMTWVKIKDEQVIRFTVSIGDPSDLRRGRENIDVEG